MAPPKAADAGVTSSAARAGEIVEMAVSGASYLVLLMTMHRAATFALNQLLLRYTNPAVFGAASIQLELLLGSALFIAREGMRLALLRVQARPRLEKEEQQGKDTAGAAADYNAAARQVNHAWLAVPFTALTTAVMATLYLWDSQKPHEVPGFHTAVLLYAAAAVLESPFEPIYVLTQYHFRVAVRVLVESAALVVRCLVTFYLVVYQGYGVLAFGIAQVVYSATLVAGYYGYMAAGFARSRKPLGLGSAAELLPHRTREGAASRYFDPSLLSLAGTFTLQSVLKYLLSEGDRMVLAVVMPLFDQGVYALVYNYGSLVARLLFQPIEEVSRTMFAKLVDASTVDDVDSTVAPATVVVRSLLVALVKGVTVVGLVFVTFGANYTHLLIHLLLGSTWGDTAAPTVLAWYCVYVLVMGVNGITEAFLYATGSKRQIEHLNRFLVVFAVIFAALSFVLINRFGTVGLVLANCCNMALRIAYSTRFIGQYFARKQAPLHWSAFLLSARTIAVFAAAFAALHAVAHGWLDPFGFHPTFYHHPAHPEALASSLAFVALGVVALAVVAAHTFTAERVLFRELQRLLQSRGRAAEHRR